jgi:Ca2+:H+ antiporter
MALVFNAYELIAIVIAVLVARFFVIAGESTWFDGIQLLSLYCALGIAAFFIS